MYFIHSRFQALRLISLLDVPGHTNNNWLLDKIQFADLFGHLDAIQDRHIEISKNYFIAYVVFDCKMELIKGFLPSYSEVHPFVNIYF